MTGSRSGEAIRRTAGFGEAERVAPLAAATTARIARA
jgi:hypothetical protein